MRFLRTALACGIVAAAIVSPTLAQAPQDVPREHWAYAAVDDLASKGLIKGFPPSGDFFGKRTVTRYEMAVVIQRVLARIDELIAKKADKGEAGGGVSAEQLEEVRRLVQEYKTELTVIGTDLQKVKDQIGEVSAKADAALRTADEAKAAADKAGADAAAAGKAATGAAADAKAAKDATAATAKTLKTLSDDYKAHRIGGYIQARFEAFDRGQSSLFTNGGAGGTGQTPSTGGPAVGGPYYGFLVRRARLRASGPISQRTGYQIQLDAQSAGAVSLIDAFVDIRDFLGKGITGRFGQFTPPFGYELFTSASVRESPERAFGFGTGNSDYPIFKTGVNATGGTLTAGSVLPLFLGQNRDVGAQVQWSAPGKAATKLTLAVINGEGRAAGGVRNSNNGLDAIARAETTLFNNKLGVGVSGYYGTLAVRGGPPTGSPAAPVPFVNAFRTLAGADVRYTLPWKTQLRAEYVGGLFETTPDRSQYLQGNHAQSWYALARHPFSRKLDGVLKYDEYMPISQTGKTAGGLGRAELIRKTLSIGALYQLDEATRLRLWYAKGLTPYDPSAASGPLRSRLGLITGEVQVVF